MFACSCTSAFCGCVGVDIMQFDKDKDCTNLMRTTFGKNFGLRRQEQLPNSKVIISPR